MLLAASFVASLLVPQGEARVSGRVLDDADHPVAAAVVTLLHRPISRHLDPATEHRLVVQTDASGTFRAPVRSGLLYSTWARWATAASQVAEGVAAGDFLELRQAGGTAPLVVNIEGLDAWAEAATFRWRALVGSEQLDLVPVERDGAELVLPALPPMQSRTIEVLDGRGEVLWADRVSLRPEGVSLTLPPPAEYTVRVADDAGKPIAEVEILAHIVNYWITQSDGVFPGDRFRALWPMRGKTDGEGRLHLRVPQRAEGNAKLLLLSRKDGYAMSCDGIRDGHAFRDGKQLPAEPVVEDQRTIAITLHAREPVNVPLRLPDGTAFGDQILFLVGRVQIQDNARGSTGIPFPLHLPVVAGTAMLRSPLPPTAAPELAWTQLAPALAKDLLAKHGVAPALEFRLPHADRLLAKDAPVQLDPQRYRLLQVLAADGRPAARTIVQLRDNLQEPGRLHRTDRLGRLLFPIGDQVRASVFCRDGMGGIDIATDQKEPTRLTLRAAHRATGRVVDGEGKPVAGANVQASIKGSADGEILAAEHHELSYLLRLDDSDRDGRFEVLLPPFCAEVELTIDAVGMTTNGGTNFSWDPTAPPEILVTVDKR